MLAHPETEGDQMPTMDAEKKRRQEVRRQLRKKERIAALSPEARDKALQAERERRRKYMRQYRKDKPEKNQAAVDKYRLAHPDIAGKMKRTRYQKLKANDPEKLRAARRGTKMRRRNRDHLKAHPQELLSAAFSALPSMLPRHTRDDIAADIMMAALSGKFSIADIPGLAKDFTAAHFRMFTKFGPESLDTDRFDGDGPSLHDKLSVGLWGEQDDEDGEDDPDEG